MICDNPRCQFHFNVKNVRPDAPYARVARVGDGSMKVTEVRRYEHRFHKHPGFSFYFCDACHNAVQMTL